MNYLLFLLLGLFWSGSFIFIKVSVMLVPPLFAAFLRVLIAEAAFTVLFIFQKRQFKIPFASMWRLWGVGIFLQGIPFALLFSGECFASPGLAAIINATVAIWALCFNIVLFRDYTQVTLMKVSGLGLGILGVLIVFFPAVAAHSHSKVWGIIAITGMAMSYALGALLSQRFCRSRYNVGLQSSLWHQHLASLTFLLILSLILESPLHIGSALTNVHLWFALLYLGIFSTACAWFIYCHLIATWGAVRASTVVYLLPVFACLWDMIFLHIFPVVSEVCGILVILVGVACIQLSRQNALPGQKPIPRSS